MSESKRWIFLLLAALLLPLTVCLAVEATGTTTGSAAGTSTGGRVIELLALLAALFPLNEARKAWFLAVARRVAHVVEELDRRGRLQVEGDAKLAAAVAEWERRHWWALVVPRGVMAYWLQFAVDSDPELGATAKPAAISALKFVALALLFGAAPAWCAPTTAPADVLDLASLQRAPTGRQNDAGASWPAGFRVRRPVVVFVVEESATGALYLMDPEQLAEGRAGLHPWLVAVGRYGTITTRQQTQRLIEAEVRERARLWLQRAVVRLATELPSQLSSSAPSILRLALGALAGVRP